MTKLFGCLTLVGLIFLAACGDTGAPPNPFPNDQPAGPTNPNNPDTPSAPVDTSKCTYVLTKNVTVPTRLENTSAGCDYLLKGQVYVKSKLVIDPGVVVVAQQDSGITVKGGEIQALGTPQQRIVMQGFKCYFGLLGRHRFRRGTPKRF